VGNSDANFDLILDVNSSRSGGSGAWRRGWGRKLLSGGRWLKTQIKMIKPATHHEEVDPNNMQLGVQEDIVASQWICMAIQNNLARISVVRGGFKAIEKAYKLAKKENMLLEGFEEAGFLFDKEIGVGGGLGDGGGEGGFGESLKNFISPPAVDTTPGEKEKEKEKEKETEENTAAGLKKKEGSWGKFMRSLSPTNANEEGEEKEKNLEVDFPREKGERDSFSSLSELGEKLTTGFRKLSKSSITDDFDKEKEKEAATVGVEEEPQQQQQQQQPLWMRKISDATATLFKKELNPVEKSFSATAATTKFTQGQIIDLMELIRNRAMNGGVRTFSVIYENYSGQCIITKRELMVVKLLEDEVSIIALLFKSKKKKKLNQFISNSINQD